MPLDKERGISQTIGQYLVIQMEAKNMSKEAPTQAPREASHAANTAPALRPETSPTSGPTQEPKIPSFQDRVINVVNRLAPPVATVASVGVALNSGLGAEIPAVVQEGPNFMGEALGKMGISFVDTAEAARKASAERRSTEFAPVGDVKKSGSDLVTVVQKADGTKAVASNVTYTNGAIDVHVEKNLSSGFNPTAVSKNGTTEVVAGGTTVQYRTDSGDFKQVTVPGVQSVKDVSVGPDGSATLAVVTADGHIHVDTLNTTTGAIQDVSTSIAVGNSTSQVGIRKLTEGTTVGSSRVMRGITSDTGGFFVVTKDSAGGVNVQQKEAVTEGIPRGAVEFVNAAGRTELWVVNNDDTLGKVFVNENDVKVNNKTFTPDVSKYNTSAVSVSALAASTGRGEAYMATVTQTLQNGVAVATSYIERVSLLSPADNSTHALLATTGLPTGIITGLQAQEVSGTTVLIATINGKLYGKNVADNSSWQEVGLVESQTNSTTYLPVASKRLVGFNN